MKMDPMQVAQVFYEALVKHTQGPYEGIAVLAILVGILHQCDKDDKEVKNHESILLALDNERWIRVKIQSEYITKEEYEKIRKEDITDIFPRIRDGVPN